MLTMAHPTPLTQREEQIVRAIARGLMNRQIAEELRISEQTVKNQLTTIYQKLGVQSRVQLAVYAVRNGLS
jgi:two-component system nitrate/nitrite response regulator NarL